jgi:hypothetical protein
MARFIERVSGRAWWLSSIASSTKAPTVAEIAAGILLSDPEDENPLVNVEGFSAEASSVDSPMYGASQTPKTPGEVTLSDSALTFYRDDTTNPIRTALPRGEEGFVVFAGPGGAVAAGTKVDVYPAQVTGNNPVRGNANEPATFRVGVAITGIPGEDLAVLA